jgi:lysophospholipase L1-like esterase
MIAWITCLVLMPAAAAADANSAGGTAVMEPFWKSRTMHGEGLMFVLEPGRQTATASLLFVPDKVLWLTSASGEVTYQEGRDFVRHEGSRELALTAESRIPFKKRSEMYPPKGAPQSIGEAVGGKTNLFWSEGHIFHDLQAAATYTHADRWAGHVPRYAGDSLPRTAGLLKAAKAVKLVMLGDSISEGYNASGFVKVKPYQPAYGGLLAAGLESRYRSKATLKNLAVAGQNSAWGVGRAAAVAAEEPDLVVVAFGMNDAGSPPDQFAANIRRIVDDVRAKRAEAEFILVATMLGNPEWTGARPAAYPKFRDELAKLCGAGVAMADVTAVWEEMLKHKKFADLTGNGVNHPNDFGHRLYAQVLLGLLTEEEAATAPATAPANKR